MTIGEGSNEGLMGHAKNLMLLAELLQFLGDRLGHSPGHPHINFIKDQGSHRINLGKTGFQRQQKPTHFPAGSNVTQGLQGFPRIGAKEKGDVVGSGGGGFDRFELNLKLHLFHG